MASSSRKTQDVALEIKEIPRPKVRNKGFWPTILPLGVERIVLAYYLTPTLEEVKALDEKFGDETMAPFREAIKDKIEPLLKNPILNRIYQTKPKKSHLLSLINPSNTTPEELFNNVFKEINHRPIEEQIDFLLTVYEGKWDRNEVELCFSRAKDMIRAIKENCRLVDLYSLDQLEKHISVVIYKMLDQLICLTILNAHQDSQIIQVNNHNHQQEEKCVVTAKKLASRNGSSADRNWCRAKILTVICAITLFSELGFIIFGRDDTKTIGAASSLGVFFIALICASMSAITSECSRNQVRFLTTARNRFFQLRRENAINNPSEHEAKRVNNLEEPLLTSEEQAEYKNDEESNFRFDSPK